MFHLIHRNEESQAKWGRHRNSSQKKEQEKNSEKELNKKEIRNMIDAHWAGEKSGRTSTKIQKILKRTNKR